MGKFTAAGRQRAEAENTQRQLRGRFECQECGLVSRVAYYDENDFLLVWYCEDNHESKIGGFQI